MSNDHPNILLVQLFSNGDCLYATAVARQIKNDYPGCRLTWAIAGFCKDIISENLYVDDVLITDAVKKNDVAAFRKYKRDIFAEKTAGKWDEVFVTSNMDTNLALYDGTIRGMILRAYPHPVSVPLQPVLQLRKEETECVAAFAEVNKLKTFKHVILWEYAPQSGQSTLSFEFVMSIAKKLAASPDTCVILSSASSFSSTPQIIDASVLSLRENAALTHYCTLLVGCSSGITWITTSTAAKFLPMLQLLNSQAYFINAPSVDFKRYHIEHNGLIEMSSFTEEKVLSCIEEILHNGFSAALHFNEELPLQFNTTKKIVYNLLVYREFSAIKKHMQLMVSIYGRHPLLLKAFFSALAGAPFKLVKNRWKKGPGKNKNAQH